MNSEKRTLKAESLWCFHLQHQGHVGILNKSPLLEMQHYDVTENHRQARLKANLSVRSSRWSQGIWKQWGKDPYLRERMQSSTDGCRSAFCSTVECPPPCSYLQHINTHSSHRFYCINRFFLSLSHEWKNHLLKNSGADRCRHSFGRRKLTGCW